MPSQEKNKRPMPLSYVYIPLLLVAVILYAVPQSSLVTFMKNSGVIKNT